MDRALPDKSVKPASASSTSSSTAGSASSGASDSSSSSRPPDSTRAATLGTTPPPLGEPAPPALSELAPLQVGAQGSNPTNDIHASAAAASAATASESPFGEPLWPELAPSGTERHARPAHGYELAEGTASSARVPVALREARQPTADGQLPLQLPAAPWRSNRSVRPTVPPAPPPRVEPGQPAAYPGPADLADIQGLVYHSWVDQPFAAYQFAKLGDAARARAWLVELLPQVTASVGYRRDRGRLQVALSPDGLAALGVPAEVVAQLPHEARAGMRDRARVLGDEEPSNAPSNAPSNGPTASQLGDHRELEVMVMMFASDDAARTAMVEAQRAALERAGATLSPVELSQPMPEQREHFGFVDGISQPFIHGLYRAPRPGRDVVAAGEIVLGYPNAYDRLPHSPKWDGFDLGHNGSYLVFRKLEQHVERFWGYLTEAARALHPDDAAQVPATAEHLAAKVMGRWRSGAPMATSPDRDDPDATTPERINTFGYRDEDREGLRCPISSHVRRANPRDTQSQSVDTSLKVIGRHRILRRGRAWGPPLDERLSRAGVGDEQSRGLYFICLQTSIARGFEFIQQTWLNNPGFGRLHGENDPLTGGGCPFTIPAEPVRLRLPRLPRFVTARGGGYFFLPSISALQRIARQP